jgi:hypothetical protein
VTGTFRTVGILAGFTVVFVAIAFSMEPDPAKRDLSLAGLFDVLAGGFLAHRFLHGGRGVWFAVLYLVITVGVALALGMVGGMLSFFSSGLSVVFAAAAAWVTGLFVPNRRSA